MNNLGILIIDMQPKFVNLHLLEDLELIENQLKLIKHAKEREIPLFVMEYVTYNGTVRELKEELIKSKAIFIEKYNDNGFIKIENPQNKKGKRYLYAPRYDEVTFHSREIKEAYENNVQESELSKRLKEKNIINLILAGVNKYACILETAKEAKKRGFNIITSKEIMNHNHIEFKKGEKWYKDNTNYFNFLKEALDLTSN